MSAPRNPNLRSPDSDSEDRIEEPLRSPDSDSEPPGAPRGFIENLTAMIKVPQSLDILQSVLGPGQEKEAAKALLTLSPDVFAQSLELSARNIKEGTPDRQHSEASLSKAIVSEKMSRAGIVFVRNEFKELLKQHALSRLDLEIRVEKRDERGMVTGERALVTAASNLSHRVERFLHAILSSLHHLPQNMQGALQNLSQSSVLNRTPGLLTKTLQNVLFEGLFIPVLRTAASNENQDQNQDQDQDHGMSDVAISGLESVCYVLSSVSLGRTFDDPTSPYSRKIGLGLGPTRRLNYLLIMTSSMTFIYRLKSLIKS